MSHGDEAELIRQAAAGDRGALAELLLAHYDDLGAQIERRIDGDLQGLLRADDVLHQVFVRAAQNIATFEPRQPSAFRAWLTTIAENLIRDAAKRRRRERRAPDQRPSRPGPGEDSAAALVDQVPGDFTTPGGGAQRSENVRRMQAALAALPDDQRQVIERHYLQDQSYERIAADLGCSKDAVRGMCYRARKNLRDLLGRSSLYFSG